MVEIKTITDDSYIVETGRGLVVVDFWAKWCAPCKMQATVIEKLAPKMDGVQFCKINSDENPQISTTLGILTLPALIIYKDGELVQRIVGLLSEAQLRNHLERFI